MIVTVYVCNFAIRTLKSHVSKLVLPLSIYFLFIKLSMTNTTNFNTLQSYLHKTVFNRPLRKKEVQIIDVCYILAPDIFFL